MTFAGRPVRRVTVGVVFGEISAGAADDTRIAPYFAVIVDELRRDGVDPAPVIAQLVATIAPLRNAIATA